MSDADIPDRFGPAAKWAVAGIVLFILGLGVSDEIRERDYGGAAIYAALFLTTFVVAVKWDWLAHLIGARKVTMFYMGLALVCALGLGLALGKLMGRTATAETPVVSVPGGSSETGRVVWSFDRPERSYFLGFNRTGDEEARVSGFSAVGKNTSDDPITQFKGYIRSNITNEELPIYLMAEDPNVENSFGRNIPTLAEETFGIPGRADFGITTFNKAVFEGGIDGTPFSKFLRDFGAFTLVLQYDGIIVRRNFSKQDIEDQLAFFESQMDPRKGTVPRVTRRPNATPPVQQTFPFPLPQAPHQAPKDKD